MKYYIAGPMTGLPEYNYPAFEKAKKDLTALGFEVVSPHDIDHGETEETRGSKPYTEYLKSGLQLLLECDGIILLSGWSKSKGALAEFNLATWVGMDHLIYDVETGALH